MELPLTFATSRRLLGEHQLPFFFTDIPPGKQIPYIIADNQALPFLLDGAVQEAVLGPAEFFDLKLIGCSELGLPDNFDNLGLVFFCVMVVLIPVWRIRYSQYNDLSLKN